MGAFDIDQYYLCHVSFFGTNFHGWQKQPSVPTLQSYFEQKSKSIFGEAFKKIIGCSRTDAGVHADNYYFLLIAGRKLSLSEVNTYLCINDTREGIKVFSFKHVEKFSIINVETRKHYIYRFSLKDKYLDAHNILNIVEDLDPVKMVEGASFFNGEHDFKLFTIGDTSRKKTRRTILNSSLKYDKDSEVFEFNVESCGFLRYQIRYMVGALINLGNGNKTLEQLKESLSGKEKSGFLTPSRGLTLAQVFFEYHVKTLRPLP